MKKEKNLLTEEPVRLAACIVGSLIYACGVGLFTSPSGLYSGGFMGISQIIRTLLTDYAGISFGNFDIAGILYFFLNLPVLWLAYRSMSRIFFVKTLTCVAASTFFLSLVQVSESLLAGDVLGSAIIGGILTGLGIGLVLYFGGSSGGMDIVSLYLARKNQSVSVGRLGMTVNFVIYGICLLMFDVSVAIYSIIYATFSGVVVDRVHAQNINMQAMIITATDGLEIEREVMKRLSRGVTHWDGVGAYRETHKTVLFVILSKYEVGMLKQILKEYDPHAFMVIQQGVSIHGFYQKHL
ncbi:MAG: YitT family protein [Lachnospiraceae bacterium]|jgi:uncharacterized membrane-anchored protein YitT (DUF2179 family)|nr:YitT family protein [Lachnospiraceae bacterium]